MIFLNGLLALGALAFTVPLAIHLLFRNRFELMDWGAMRFLESVIRVNRRRLQLRNLLLLLLRCAIPILLAFCLARPVLTGWQTLAGDSPLSLVLAIDTSYSLAAQVDTNARKIDRIQATAQQLVSALPRGSDVTIVTSADAVDETASLYQGDPQGALNALQSLQLSGGPLSLERLLSSSLRKAAALPTEHRHIVLLTDESASDFSQSQMDAFESLSERRKAISPAPSLAWIRPWDDYDLEPKNRRMMRLIPSQSAAVPGQVVNWTVEARTENDAAATTTLDIRVDGEALESQPLTFRRGVALANFKTTFPASGRHVVEASLPAEDEFSPDDRLRADFNVMPAIDVWLVDGNPSNEPLKSDTDFLAIALSPFSLAGEKAVDLFHTTKISASKLGQKSDQSPKIVVLADVPTLSADAIRWLRQFVEEQGGVLVAFAGSATKPEWQESELTGSDGKPLLPLVFKTPIVAAEGTSGFKIDENRMTFPPLAAFMRDAEGTLSTVDVTTYLTTLPREGTDEPNVIMRLNNGAPLAAITKVGRGQVLQVATTANDRWTSLPRRLAFVPLVQHLFLHLVTGESKFETPSAGEPIAIDLQTLVSETDESQSDKAQGNKGDKQKQLNGSTQPPLAPPESWRVMTPAGESLIVSPTDAKLRILDTRQAGVYRIEREGAPVSFAAVNVPESELRRVPLDASVREDAAKRLGATAYDSLAAYQNDDSARRYGRGVWRYLLLALLAALVVEPFLQQRGAKAVS